VHVGHRGSWSENPKDLTMGMDRTRLSPGDAQSLSSPKGMGVRCRQES